MRRQPAETPHPASRRHSSAWIDPAHQAVFSADRYRFRDFCREKPLFL
jgi:hypothetical protein